MSIHPCGDHRRRNTFMIGSGRIGISVDGFDFLVSIKIFAKNRNWLIKYSRTATHRQILQVPL